MKRILIIERESAVITPIKKAVESLNLHPTVFLTWNLALKTIPLNEVVAVFINVEMLRIEISEIVNYFNKNHKTNNYEIPVYFMFSQKRMDIFSKIKNVKHAGELSKPFKLEEIYYLLEKSLALLNLELEQYDLYFNIKKFEDYSSELGNWLENIKVLMKK